MTVCEIREATLADVPDGCNDRVMLANSLDSWVLSIDGVEVGVGGFEGYSGGRVCQAWAYPGPGLGGNALAVTRMIRARIRDIFRRNPDLVRIQAHVHEYDIEAFRFAVVCGFYPESIMERSAPDGQAMVMFRILKGH